MLSIGRLLASAAAPTSRARVYDESFHVKMGTLHDPFIGSSASLESPPLFRAPIMLRRLVRSFLRRPPCPRGIRPRMPSPAGPVEPLESRTLLSVTFRFDYRYDTSGYFRDPARRAMLELAGHIVADRIDSHLEAIRPTARRTWTTLIRNPETNTNLVLKNPKVAADEILVFPGATRLKGNAEEIGLVLTVPDTIQKVKGTSDWHRDLLSRGLGAPQGDRPPSVIPRVPLSPGSSRLCSPKDTCSTSNPRPTG
ncbi:MAG: hypothetical protein JWN86_4 [Planctomycetota bacterium]|nr:hypothetical protein [Planctomycetota bacterium]